MKFLRLNLSNDNDSWICSIITIILFFATELYKGFSGRTDTIYETYDHLFGRVLMAQQVNEIKMTHLAPCKLLSFVILLTR